MIKMNNEWLLAAVKGDERKLVNMLQKDSSLANAQGLTPLHMAASNTQSDAIVLLTSTYGANITIRDHVGRLPGAYLPISSAGNKLRQFFKESISLLLIEDTDDMLALLVPTTAQCKNVNRSRSRSKSPSLLHENMMVAETTQSNVPLTGHFPWQSARGSIDSRSSASAKGRSSRDTTKRRNRGSRLFHFRPSQSNVMAEERDQLTLRARSSSRERHRQDTEPVKGDCYAKYERFMDRKLKAKSKRSKTSSGKESGNDTGTDDTISCQSLSMASTRTDDNSSQILSP